MCNRTRTIGMSRTCPRIDFCRFGCYISRFSYGLMVASSARFPFCSFLRLGSTNHPLYPKVSCIRIHKFHTSRVRWRLFACHTSRSACAWVVLTGSMDFPICNSPLFSSKCRLDLLWYIRTCSDHRLPGHRAGVFRSLL